MNLLTANDTNPNESVTQSHSLTKHETDFQTVLHDFLVTSWTYFNTEHEEINLD